MCFESMFFHSKIHVYERIMVKKVRRTRSNGKNANMVPIIRIRNANEIMNLLTFFAFISTLSKWAQATDRFLTVVTFPVKSTVQMTWFTAMISEWIQQIFRWFWGCFFLNSFHLFVAGVILRQNGVKIIIH